MNRRHVLRTLAVMSASSTTVVALGRSSSACLTATVPQNLSAILRESRELCIELLGRLDRVGSRRDLVAGSNSTANKAGTHSLQELLVLLEQADARISITELRAVALLQACVDALLRVEKPLNSLCEGGMLHRPVVDSSITAFGQVRQLLSGLAAA